MKKILLIGVVWLLPHLLLAQYENKKVITKSYDVSGKGSLAIKGHYSDIHIDTWSQNKVEAKIEIKVSKKSQRATEELLSKIDIDIDDVSKEALRFTTNIKGAMNIRSGEKVKIVYTIKAPSTLNFKIDNSYGNFYIADNSGKNSFTIAYGNIKVGNCTGTTHLKLSYGNGEIEQISKSELEVNYSNLSIGDLGTSEVENNYSNIDGEEGAELTIENRYGNVKLASSNSLYGGSKYGSVKLSKLYKVLDFNGGIKLGWISKDFERINIEAKYESIELHFEKGFGAELEAEMNYCNLKFGDIPFDYSRLSERSQESYYKGIIGTKEHVGNRKVHIKSAYGNAKMSYASN